MFARLQAGAHVTSDVTLPAVRRAVERRQQQRYRAPQQRRQFHDDYDYDYYTYDNDDSSYYNTYLPRSASLSSFHGLVDNGEDDSGLFVQRITVGPY